MKLGLTKRTKVANAYQNQPQVQPQLVSNYSEKPSPSGYTQEDVDRLIKNATEKITKDFQAQFRDLQSKIPTTSAVPIKPETVTPPEYYPVNPAELFDRIGNKYEKSDSGIFQKAGAELRAQDKKRADNIDRIATRIAERLEKQKVDKEIATSFPESFGKLNINDSDSMDTSNLVREIATDDDEYTLQLVRKKSNLQFH